MECDYLYGWIKKRSHTQKSLSKKVMKPRDLAGNEEEEKKFTTHTVASLEWLDGSVLPGEIQNGSLLVLNPSKVWQRQVWAGQKCGSHRCGD